MTDTKTTPTADRILAYFGTLSPGAEGMATAADVAEALSIGRSTATKALRDLYEAGKLTRTVPPGPRPPFNYTLPAPAEAEPERATTGAPARTEPQTATEVTTFHDLVVAEPKTTRSGAPRLTRGSLATQVENYLRTHTGEVTASKIGKDLDRSPGAVANALARLVDAGKATKVSDKPKRFTAPAAA